MGKRFWVMVLKRYAIALALAFMLGVAIEYYSQEEMYRKPVQSGLICIAVYLVTSFLLGMFNAVASLIYLWWFGGSDMEGSVLDDFRRVKPLAPSRYQPKNFDYLAMLADDEAVAANERVKAALLHGSYNTALSHGLIRSITFRQAIDAAVLRWSAEAPAPKEPVPPEDDYDYADFDDWPQEDEAR